MLKCYLSFLVNISKEKINYEPVTLYYTFCLCVLLLYIQGSPYSLFLSKRQHFVNMSVYTFLTSAESTLTKNGSHL